MLQKILIWVITEIFQKVELSCYISPDNQRHICRFNYVHAIPDSNSCSFATPKRNDCLEEFYKVAVLNFSVNLFKSKLKEVASYELPYSSSLNILSNTETFFLVILKFQISPPQMFPLDLHEIFRKAFP